MRPRPHLLITRLVKRYGNVFAVNDVFGQGAARRSTHFAGPSGSGKTTTLSIIAGFEQQTSGEILREGKPLTPVPPHERDIGMVFQKLPSVQHVGVRQCRVSALGSRPGQAGDFFRGQAHAAARAPRWVRRQAPDQLSGGQQQRVALARVLIYGRRSC